MTPDNMSKTVIIMGSARSSGATRTLVDYLIEKEAYELVDLHGKNIGYFDYEFKNKNDEFLELITTIIEKYDTIIFATPVYFYAMSAVMKNFFDRLGDLIFINKDLGRQLRGKSMAMLSCGAGKELKNGFQMPFSETANYLGMTYLGDVHGWLENKAISTEVAGKLDEFITKVKTGN